MNLIDEMLKDLNIDFFIVDEDNNIIESTCSDENLILDIIKNSNKHEQSIIGYNSSFYRCGTKSYSGKTIYYIQDVTDLEKKYSCLKKDNLTKLYTRNIAIPLLDEYIMNAFQKKESFSIIMSDIDYFKKINDQFGHDAGDRVLQDIAMIFLNRFRTRDNYNLTSAEDLRKNTLQEEKPKDILCRYGGEEFLIILKNINIQNTLKRIEEVRSIIEEKGIVTVSFGICNVDEQLLDEEVTKENVEKIRNRLIKIADQGLYCSKNGGRNQVYYFDTDKNEYSKVNPKVYYKNK